MTYQAPSMTSKQTATDRVIVNVSEHGRPGWDWVGGRFPEDPFRWKSYSAVPTGPIESRFGRPHVGRYRAAAQGIAAARRHDAALIVTHEPLVAAAVGALYQSTQLRMPHLALAFTFSKLPAGARRTLIKRAIRRVDRFVCFSSIERRRYAEYFDIPIEKISVWRWSVSVPEYDLTRAPIEQGEYLCAIGGEGRDVATLLAAMEQLPSLRLSLVTRPDNLEGLNVPDNVTVRTNIPFEDVWNITHHARLHVLPLVSSDMPCGHGTLIMAMQLGTPSVVTESEAMTDYVEDGKTGVVCRPQDPSALASSITRLWQDEALSAKLVEAGRRFAIEECSEARTVEYFQEYLRGHGLL